MSFLSADWLRLVPPGPLSRLLARSIGCVPKTLTDLDRSGLAGAVGTEDAEALPRGDRQQHAAQNRLLPYALCRPSTATAGRPATWTRLTGAPACWRTLRQ
jgi:hypothetical protein